MFKIIWVITLFLFSFNVYAYTDCIGVPNAVKMGEFGAQEEYAIVNIGSNDYRLGLPAEDTTKVRLSIVQSALLAEKKARLRFWFADTCSEASTKKQIPNSVQLIK